MLEELLICGMINLTLHYILDYKSLKTFGDNEDAADYRADC